MRALPRHVWVGYAAAVLATACAAEARGWLGPALGPRSPWITYFLAVTLASYIGGLGPGVLATVLGVLSVHHGVPSPDPGLPPGPADATTVLFVVVATVIAIVCQSLHDSQRRERELAARYRLAYEHAPVLIWEADPAGGCAYVNRTWQEFTGRDADASRGGGWLDAVHPDDRPRWREVFRTAAAARGPILAELRLARADGEDRWVLAHGVPRLGPAGRLDGYAGVCVDLTDRRRGEALRQLLADVTAALAEAPAPEAALGAVARHCVPALGDWCAIDLVRPGGSAERVAVAHADPLMVELGRDLARRYPPRPPGDGASVVGELTDAMLRDAAHDEEHLKAIRELGLRSAMRVPLAARGRKLGALTLATAESGRRLGPADLGLAQAIADRCALAIDNARLAGEARALLRDRTEALARFRQIAELVPAFVWALGPGGAVTFVNRRMREFTGIEPGRAGGWLDAVHPDDRDATRAAWDAAARAGGPFQAELRLRRAADGAYRWVLARAEPQPDAGGEAEWLGTASDIDDRKKTEEALRDAHRLKDEFLSVVSHELRNPLAAVRSAVAVLARGPDAPTAARMTAVIDRQSEHLERLVDDLLDVSRVVGGRVRLKKRPVELGAVLDSAVEEVRPAAEAAGQVLEVAKPAGPVWLDADPTRLTQVVANLLGNAAKYTPAGGRIALRAAAAGGEVAVTVRDTGVGIPADLLPRVFDLFVQADPGRDAGRGGLGIGLSLVRSLVELHGGTVEAKSDGPGTGSEFAVRLPLLAGDPPPPTDGPAPCEPATNGRRRRVLVVEDSRDAADALVTLLGCFGHEVRAVGDGVAALGAIPEFRPDVVLCDIGLPGLDGYEVARRARGGPGGGRLVLAALTGFGQEDDVTRAREAGFDRHFTKPIDPDELLAFLGSPAG